MAQRSRKRGRRERPAGPGNAATGAPAAGPGSATISPPARKPADVAPADPTGSPLSNDFIERYRARTEERNAAVRSTLEPLAPGERPWPLVVGVVLTGLAGVANLILFVAGVKIAGKHPAPGGIVLFSGVMLVCAVGMWRLWYQAVLAFMALLAIVVVLFSLFLVEASNLLGFLVPPVFIVAGGYLFWKLVRVLGRLQMPARPGR